MTRTILRCWVGSSIFSWNRFHVSDFSAAGNLSKICWMRVDMSFLMLSSLGLSWTKCRLREFSFSSSVEHDLNDKLTIFIPFFSFLLDSLHLTSCLKKQNQAFRVVCNQRLCCNLSSFFISSLVSSCRLFSHKKGSRKDQEEQKINDCVCGYKNRKSTDEHYS